MGTEFDCIYLFFLERNNIAPNNTLIATKVLIISEIDSYLVDENFAKITLQIVTKIIKKINTSK